MSGPEGCDPALLELFRAEMDAHIPVLNQGLLALEKNQAGEKDFEAMMRAAHSIKGAARIVGIDAAVRVAHVLEDCFSAAQGHRIALNSSAVDVLLEGVDALQRICSPDTAGIADGAIPGLIDRLALIREGRAPAPSRPPEPPPAPPDLHPVAEAGPCCVTLPANLDSAAAESLRKELSAILSARVPRIRLDYSEVRQCGAAFLALLASLAREAARADRPLDIESTGVSGELACLLRTTGLNVALGQGG